ncbi:S24/S26 family peptidase [Carbonactinospora thermoautotrophica]|uniref:S24/S26 family peptidase n=1 Tax=Carbonactinospora thermoautotrophica TaxID=1469144 RepID=UPI00082DBB46|nr:S24/S26 family peptidase [Carbonactinospora thermoautotrophica]
MGHRTGGPGRHRGRFPWGRVAVVGRSMEPTLYEGDHLLVRWGGAPKPGRLVVVHLPGRGLSVKRAFRRTPEGWWVERDNPAEGIDSWHVGAIPDEDVLAVVVCRYWPPFRRRR